jgi:hypothetical protein
MARGPIKEYVYDTGAGPIRFAYKVKWIDETKMKLVDQQAWARMAGWIFATSKHQISVRRRDIDGSKLPSKYAPLETTDKSGKTRKGRLLWSKALQKWHWFNTREEYRKTEGLPIATITIKTGAMWSDKSKRIRFIAGNSNWSGGVIVTFGGAKSMPSKAQQSKAYRTTGANAEPAPAAKAWANAQRWGGIALIGVPQDRMNEFQTRLQAETTRLLLSQYT